MRLGVMVSIQDFKSLVLSDADFSELLLFDGDIDRIDSRLLDELSRAVPTVSFVHAQEFVRHDGRQKLLDLTSEDEGFRSCCTKVVDESRKLARSLGAIGLVIHPGGIRGAATDHESLFSNLERSLEELGPRDLLLENMPWYYWQKGAGRMVSNVCVSVDDMVRVSSGVEGLVLDTAHGYLSRREGSQDYLTEFMEILGKDMRHVHLSDARAPDEEGLQIGEGDIDFSFMKDVSAPVMVEVWNGHLQNWTGFRKGIRRLRNMERGWTPAAGD